MTLGEIASLVGGTLHGPPETEISGPVAVDSKPSGGIAFAESAKYLAIAERSGAAALLLPPGLVSDAKPFIEVADARTAFFVLLSKASRPLPLGAGVHPTAVVSPNASVDATAQVGPYAVVERGALVGPNSRIFPFAYVGEDCVLDEGCTIYPHAVLYQRVRLGKRVTVHAGAVLGGDGFGYAWSGRERIKIPQVGAVVVADDCEIGALTAIDRATVGETTLGRGVKVDNLVQIAHNVTIGDDCAIASQAGIAGSAKIGNRVIAGGQVGVADHIQVADDVALAARSAVLQDIDEPGEYIGTPARPAADAKKAMLLVFKLPELFARLRKLEKRADGQ